LLSVLVVDDEESIRHMLTMLLKKAQYNVRSVENGEEALKELLVRAYDLVLCDIRMPQMDGLTLLAEVVSREIKTCVIMMSAYGDVDTALDAIKRGAYDYVAKPFKKDEVLLTLQKAEEREDLRKENAALKAQRDRAFTFENIVARSPAMLKVFDVVRKVAGYKTTVLIQGESGTGKELVARAIHVNSDRRSGPWVPINCGAIPESLLESELFGHVKGAFTDASRDKEGLFQRANGGTLFLDEVGELPFNLQVKLLRVLQESEVRRVGDTVNTPIDVRVVAASLKDLAARVEDGEFREDLYYRLNVLPIRLPSLRERKEDIPLLVEHFLTAHGARLGVKPMPLTPAAMKLLVDYAWPGNVRELENTMEMAMVLSDGHPIDVDALPPKVAAASDPLKLLLTSDDLSIKRATREVERVLIERALKKTRGNRTQAAKLLELSHRALLYKIKEYVLEDVR